MLDVPVSDGAVLTIYLFWMAVLAALLYLQEQRVLRQFADVRHRYSRFRTGYLSWIISPIFCHLAYVVGYPLIAFCVAAIYVDGISANNLQAAIILHGVLVLMMAYPFFSRFTLQADLEHLQRVHELDEFHKGVLRLRDVQQQMLTRLKHDNGQEAANFFLNGSDLTGLGKLLEKYDV